MKAKKVYEFINPKTDKYELEDTLPLGPNALKIKEIKEWLQYNETDISQIKVEIRNKYIFLDFSKYDDEIDLPYFAPKFPYIILKFDDGTYWYFNDELHREDGPAIEWNNGDGEWWLNNNEYPKEEYDKIIKNK